jgi:hypothetical protein
MKIRWTEIQTGPKPELAKYKTFTNRSLAAYPSINAVRGL